jgi:8-oxo-dGTP pyrophosphatase MutT (NUDIX family)
MSREILKSSGAFIVHGGKVLLFHRDDKPGVPDPGKWGLVGGSAEPGETYDEALCRECEEEIGIRPTDYKLGGVINYHDGYLHALYMVRLSDEEVSRIKKGEEGQGLGWFYPEEISNLDFGLALSIYFDNCLPSVINVVKNGLTRRGELNFIW